MPFTGERVHIIIYFFPNVTLFFCIFAVQHLTGELVPALTVNMLYLLLLPPFVHDASTGDEVGGHFFGMLSKLRSV